MHYYTRGQAAKQFLKGIGAPVTENNMLTMMSWMQAEGDAGRFNFLNTTLYEPGSTIFNWVGVRNYLTFKNGVRATVKTLQSGARRGLYGYGPIYRGLRANASPATVLTAVEGSAWGTGGLALDVYEGTPNATLLAYRHHRLVH